MGQYRDEAAYRAAVPGGRGRPARPDVREDEVNQKDAAFYGLVIVAVLELVCIAYLLYR